MRRPTKSTRHAGTALRAIASVKRDEHGHKIRPPRIPKPFVELPWNSWTFERAEGATGDYFPSVITIGDIITQIRNNVGIAATSEIRIKVQSASHWCITSGGLTVPDLEATYFELAGESAAATQYPRSRQRSKGTFSTPAVAGYRYTLADRREVLGGTESTLEVCSGLAIEMGVKITTRVHVLWQSTPTLARYQARQRDLVLSDKASPLKTDVTLPASLKAQLEADRKTCDLVTKMKIAGA